MLLLDAGSEADGLSGRLVHHDNFSGAADTAVTSHTADVRQSAYTEVTASHELDGAGGLRPNDDGSGGAFPVTTTEAAADIYLEMLVRIGTEKGAQGMRWRSVDASNDYRATIAGSAERFDMFRRVAGSNTTLVSDSGLTDYAAGDVVRVQIWHYADGTIEYMAGNLRGRVTGETSHSTEATIAYLSQEGTGPDDNALLNWTARAI